MLSYMINVVWDYCCFGKKKKLVDEIKEDIKFLTDKELNHLKMYLIKGLKDSSNYCC